MVGTSPAHAMTTILAHFLKADRLASSLWRSAKTLSNSNLHGRIAQSALVFEGFIDFGHRGFRQQ